MDWSNSGAMGRRIGGPGTLNHKQEIIRTFELKFHGVKVNDDNWKSCSLLARGAKKFDGTYSIKEGGAISKVTNGLKNIEAGVGLVNIFELGVEGAKAMCKNYFEQQLPRLLEVIAACSQEDGSDAFEVLLSNPVFEDGKGDVMSFGAAFSLVGEIYDANYGGNYSNIIDGSGGRILRLVSSIELDFSKVKKSADRYDVTNGYLAMGRKACGLLLDRYVLALLVQKGIVRVINGLIREGTKEPMRELALPVSQDLSISYHSIVS